MQAEGRTTPKASNTSLAAGDCQQAVEEIVSVRQAFRTRQLPQTAANESIGSIERVHNRPLPRIDNFLFIISHYFLTTINRHKNKVVTKSK